MQGNDELGAANTLLMSGGIRAEKYSHTGDVVAGTILSAKEDLEYEMELQNGKWVRTGEVRRWKNSNEPKKQIIITVQTDQREDAEDDGRRLMFFDSYRIPALRDAVRKTGATGLAIGAQIAKRWDSGSGNPGDPKVYSVGYVAPAMNLPEPPANGHQAPVAPRTPAPATQPAPPPPTMAGMSAPPAPAAPLACPPGVDPAVWGGLPVEQQRIILASMASPAATAPPF